MKYEIEHGPNGRYWRIGACLTMALLGAGCLAGSRDYHRFEVETVRSTLAIAEGYASEVQAYSKGYYRRTFSLSPSGAESWDRLGAEIVSAISSNPEIISVRRVAGDRIKLEGLSVGQSDISLELRYQNGTERVDFTQQVAQITSGRMRALYVQDEIRILDGTSHEVDVDVLDASGEPLAHDQDPLEVVRREGVSTAGLDAAFTIKPIKEARFYSYTITPRPGVLGTATVGQTTIRAITQAEYDAGIHLEVRRGPSECREVTDEGVCFETAVDIKPHAADAIYLPLFATGEWRFSAGTTNGCTVIGPDASGRSYVDDPVSGVCSIKVERIDGDAAWEQIIDLRTAAEQRCMFDRSSQEAVVCYER